MNNGMVRKYVFINCACQHALTNCLPTMALFPPSSKIFLPGERKIIINLQFFTCSYLFWALFLQQHQITVSHDWAS